MTPSQTEILDLATRVNAIVAAGAVAQLPDRAMAQMHSAVPGKPGLGVQVFQDALAPHVSARTTSDGDWQFYRTAERGGGLPATSDRLPGSRQP